jgi:hypothetical protein
MKDQFLNYTQSLALKELGFNEPCLGYYIAGQLLISNDIIYNSTDIPVIKAPLKQQAILFLLNKCDDLHGAELSIEYFGDESGILKNYGGNFTSLTQALDKLIMLANDKMP